MAETFVQTPPNSTGVKFDGYTEALNGYFRQSVVIADPIVNGGIAPVSATGGLRVNLIGTESNLVPLRVAIITDATVTGSATAAIPGNQAASTIVKATAGRLLSVLVTAPGSAALYIYDHASAASGTIIGIVPANLDVGALIAFNMPAANGIYVAGDAAAPGVTIAYS